ncbi:alpha-mannosidase [bacterium]|nr:alpha-mannosidase [bacterium]
MNSITHNTLHRSLSTLSARHTYLVERIQAQIEFAEELATIERTKARQWPALIAKAKEIIALAAAQGATGRLEAAVAQAEAILAPIGPAAKAHTVHCVGHAHIDMNWMWSWPETVAVTNDTFITMLALMDEYPDFRFSQSQASVYAIVREYHPELLERIARRVREGRWEVTAVHWVEGDKNLASGESLARHMLYTRRFMKELFGLAPGDVPLDWECDMFGHAHTIPTILARGGARRYYMCRSGQPTKPPVFWWQGPDGSRVIVVRDITGYNDHLGTHVAKNLLRFRKATGLRDWMEVYGVGDHGGGPTRRDILRCHDMNTWPVYPAFRLATTRAFYDLLEANAGKWPVLDQEINFEFAGCYTTQTMIKKANRFGENYCIEAEGAAALAARAAGIAYPAQALRDAWIDVLFGQFHDILPGSGVHWTREYQVGLFQKAAASTNMIKTHSFRALAAKIDTASVAGGMPGGTRSNESTALGAGAGRGTMEGGLSNAAHVIDGPRPFIVFNPTAWRRNEVVQATVWDADTSFSPGDVRRKHFAVRTPGGAAVPAQIVGTGDYWGHRYADLVFPAAAGALGYTAYSVEEGSVADYTGAVKTYELPPRHETNQAGTPAMENDLLAVAFDSLTGGVVKLLDKKTGKDLADPRDPLGVLEYILERPCGMSAWVIGSPQTRNSALEVTSLQFGQRGPHLASVVAKVKVAHSEVTITYTLKAGQPQLEITVATMWLERGNNQTGTPHLRMRFPFALRDARARYEIPFGSIARELNQGQEVPALRWADVSGVNGKTPAGCAVLNDSKYGHSLDGATLGVTLIRSSYEPDPLPEICEHTVRLAVAPHAAAPAEADLIRMGAALNHPLQVVGTDVHNGTLPPECAAVDVAPANVVLTSMRKAQDDDGLVFHLLETAGKAATAKVTLDAAVFGAVRAATEVDFLEREAPAANARGAGGSFTVRIPAHGIAAVNVTFAAGARTQGRQPQARPRKRRARG